MLAVGPGGLDKDGKRIAPSVTAGDKVLIPQVRVRLQTADEQRARVLLIEISIVWREPCQGAGRGIHFVQGS